MIFSEISRCKILTHFGKNHRKEIYLSGLCMNATPQGYGAVVPLHLFTKERRH